jgi:hypothetical protein
LALLAVGPVVSAVRSRSDVQRPPRPNTVFEIDARGSTALPASEWSVALQTTGQAGLIGGAAVCGDEVFLLDPKFRTVHRVSLSSGAEIERIGDATLFAYPFSIAASCDDHELYISDHSGLIVIDMRTGQAGPRFPRPQTFSNSIGTATFDAVTHHLFVPGVWAQREKDWLFNGLQQMFVDDWLGRDIDVRTGASSPLVPPLERGCFTASPLCLSVTLDRAPTTSGVAWIIAHQISTKVGLFDAHRRLLRTADIRSPLFGEDGRRVPRRTTLEEEVAWHENNSIIQSVWAFEHAFVIVHSRQRTRHWKLGGQTDFDVFVNVFGYDGRAIVSDAALPDLPVARDADSLYTISYGPGGRHVTSDRRLEIARFPLWSLTSSPTTAPAQR